MNRHEKTMLFAIALSLTASVAWGRASAEPPATATAGQPAAAASPARTGEESYDLDLDAILGARGRDVSGSIDKFQEYGTVNDGFLIESLRALYQRRGSADFLELRLQDATQDDESYRLVAGLGRYRLTAGYGALPHRFTGGLLLFSGVGTSRLRVANAVQQSLQDAEVASTTRAAAPYSPDPLVDTAQRAIVRGALDGANPLGFRVDRRRADARLEVALPRDATAWVRVQHENRDGARVIGAGTYERFVQTSAGVHTGDRFIVTGNDLAEPVDYRTLTLGAGAGLHRESWLADVEYSLTRFRNSDEVLLWDNPFRISNAPGPGGFDRGRFATGNLGLPPDSMSHEITASGAVDLPMRGRLAASASYGIITQDQAFEPYTLNTAVTATDFTGTAVGEAPSVALPARDLGGDVRTIAGSLSASVRPLDPVTVAAKYRLYRYDGRSDEIVFPGYSAFGDSLWRRERADLTGSPTDVPVANEVFDYWRHEADVGVDYRVSRMLSVGVEGGWEGWRYDHLRVDRLDEYSVGASFVVRPLRNTSLKGRYRFADRTSDGYARGVTPENPEARGLLNFNWSDRRRHLADARVQVAPHRMVSVGVLGRFVDDDYGGNTEGGTVLDDFRFGRTDARSIGGSLDVTVTPAERLAVFASYSREYRKEQMASAAKDDPVKSNVFDPTNPTTTLPDNFSPVNYWNSDVKNTVDVVAVGTSIQLLPGSLVLDTRYSLSFSDMDVNTFNPNPIVTSGQFTTLDNAIANDWPTIKSRLHEVTADLGYRVAPRVRAGVRYLFQSYDLDDFAWAVLDPYMVGRSAENTTRFLYADATYNSYKAHVGTVYVGGSF